ncbi:hypothetical protein MGYG_07891 [Nannizzia gypsea CBS 118893]|uniref:Ribosomal RNA methyltransferase FtsJ domain-containing protein n=1 Tax=Arthroderma gypseum (strain ATCC MYA-4604 / CBS 118893) TaxID=535722 RepID=E4V4G5_ARTGP|nr:hypothetical protein MGYG_07891 [Nannizzia gypsea CBS 118893]EFR04889.1 hypothetical protein MGYG_07891 [Nannizzia gypsea CBS 118893]
MAGPPVSSLTQDDIPTADEENATKILDSYLQEKSPTFSAFRAIQKIVWQSPAADKHFLKQREAADSATPALKKHFFGMMRGIGDQLQAAKHIIPPPRETKSFKVLDICMAPGGYSATVLKYNKYSRIYGLSLPEEEGGHQILLQNWRKDPRVQILQMDITMLSTELGCPNLLPPDNPAASQFFDCKPFDGLEADLIFCDGQVLRTHERAVDSKFEASRLTSAQLIIALQRIKKGGAIVILLHRVNSPQNVVLLHSFSQFAEIDLFKPTPSHATRSSFYLVAKNLDPTSSGACNMLEDLKSSWKRKTLQAFNDESPKVEQAISGTEMRDILESSFGERVISLGEPLWKIQKEALERKFLRETPKHRN